MEMRDAAKDLEEAGNWLVISGGHNEMAKIAHHWINRATAAEKKAQEAEAQAAALKAEKWHYNKAGIDELVAKESLQTDIHYLAQFLCGNRNEEVTDDGAIRAAMATIAEKDAAIKELLVTIEQKNRRTEETEAAYVATWLVLRNTKAYFQDAYFSQTGYCVKCGGFIPYKAYGYCKKCMLEAINEALKENNSGHELLDRYRRLEAQAGAMREALEAALAWMADTGASDEEFAHGEPVYGDIRDFMTKALASNPGRSVQKRMAKLESALKWIAQQPCQQPIDEHTTCCNTSMCLTEYCLPCYAETILEGMEAKS